MVDSRLREVVAHGGSTVCRPEAGVILATSPYI